MGQGRILDPVPQECPTKIPRQSLHEYAQLDTRYELAKLSYQVLWLSPPLPRPPFARTPPRADRRGGEKGRPTGSCSPCLYCCALRAPSVYPPLSSLPLPHHRR